MQTPTPRNSAPIGLLFLCIVFSNYTQAQLTYEPFNYGTFGGSLDSLSSWWSAHRAAGNNVVRFEPTGLIAPTGLPNSSGGCLRFTGGAGSREDVNRIFTAQNSGNLYVSFLLNIDSLATEDYFFHLNTSTHIARVFIKKQLNKFQIGCSKSNATAIYQGNYNFNSNYLIVIKYAFIPGTSTNDTVSLWVLSEPTATEIDAGTPNNKDFLGTDPSTIVSVCIRQGLTAITGRLDELRVATSWEDVVGTSVWNSNNTWTNGAPTARSNVKIMSNFSPDSSIHMYQLHMNNHAKLSLNGKDLHLHGTMSGKGKIAGFNGAGLHIYKSAGTIIFDSLQCEFKTIQLHENASLTIGSPVKLQAGINPGTLILGNNSQLNTGHQLTFLSNEFGSARLATLGVGALLIGKISVQKFIPARRAFRFLSTPVNTDNGLSNAWQQQTHITGNGPGFDSTASKNASIFTLHAQSQNWQPFTNTLTQDLMQGAGYRILIRGNRNINLYSNNAIPNACVLNATGFHQTGDKTYTSSSNPSISDSIGGISLLGNPFPSAINWNLVSKNQISSTYYTWRAQGGSNNKGAYVSYNAIGQSSSDGNVNAIISSGAAFMIKTTGSNPSITIKESDKTAANEGSLILGKNTLANMRIKLYEHDSILTDAVFICTHADAKPLIDAYDSEKWMNPGTSLYSVDSLNNTYSIMAISQTQIPNTIPLKLTHTEIKSYQFKIHTNNIFKKYWRLIDQYLGKEILLDTFTQYEFDISQDKASMDENRFLLSKAIGLNNKVAHTILPSFTIYPNPSNGLFQLSTSQYQNQSINFVISNVQGQILLEGELPDTKKIDCSGIGSGLFILSLQTDKHALSYKIMIE